MKNNNREYAVDRLKVQKSWLREHNYATGFRAYFHRMNKTKLYRFNQRILKHQNELNDDCN